MKEITVKITIDDEENAAVDMASEGFEEGEDIFGQLYEIKKGVHQLKRRYAAYLESEGYKAKSVYDTLSML